MGSHSKQSPAIPPWLVVIVTFLGLCTAAAIILLLLPGHPAKVKPKVTHSSSAPARVITVTPEPSPSSPVTTFATYVPMPAGGSLGSLAQQYCGNANDWMKLAAANGITNPNGIKEGELIKIAC